MRRRSVTRTHPANSLGEANPRKHPDFRKNVPTLAASEKPKIISESNILFISLMLLSGVLVLSINCIVKFLYLSCPVNRYHESTSSATKEASAPASKSDSTSAVSVEPPGPTDVAYNPATQSLNSVRIPVFMYHHIAPLPTTKGKGLYVSPTVFDQEMNYLVSHHYKTLSLQEFNDQLQTGINPNQQSVLITFDDGNNDCYQNAFPILKKYHLKATFFVVTKRLGISPAQLREMDQAGMDIASHTETHPDLTKINDSQRLHAEIGVSKFDLQAILGHPVIAIAYPGCVANHDDILETAHSGYTLGFSCGKSIDHYYSRRLVLERVHPYDDLENFKKLLVGIWEIPNQFK